MDLVLRRTAAAACAFVLVSATSFVSAGFDPNIPPVSRFNPADYLTPETLAAQLAVNARQATSQPAVAAPGATASARSTPAPLVVSFDPAPSAREAAAAKRELTAAERQKILGAYGKLPLSFIENRGQIDPSVAYYIKRPGSSTYFTREGLVLNLSKGKGEQTKQQTIAVELLDASPTSIESVQKAPGIVSYFRGSRENWMRDIPTHAKINYVSAWPGIDLAYDGAGGKLESIYTVAPHADPAQIRLRYRGASDLRLDEAGNLVYSTELGDLTETAPVAWQDIDGHRHPVATRFQIEGDTVSFKVAAFDPDHALVIDPTLVYSGFLGGDGEERGLGIAVDSSGNAYVTGWTDSGNFPGFSCGWDGCDSRSGATDAFVAKINAAGSALVYVGYLGGSGGSNSGNSIAVDSAGNAFVTGDTTSDDFPVVDCDWSNCGSYNDLTDAFVTKINAAGSDLVFSGYLGGEDGADYGNGIAVDSSGDAYVTGQTNSEDFPVDCNDTSWTDCDTYGGGGDAFLVKIDGSGSGVYSGLLSGILEALDIEEDFSADLADWGRGVAVDGSNVYVTGAVEFNFDASDVDVFVFALTRDGNTVVYGKFLVTDDWEEGYGVAADGVGNVYVTGYTDSPDFPASNCSWTNCMSGAQESAFVTKLNSTGGVVYSGFLGGNDTSGGTAIAVDSAGNAYVTGGTYATDFPVVNCSWTRCTAITGEEADAFVAKISPGGALVYSGYLGGDNSDVGLGIAVDSAGAAYVTGYSAEGDSFNLPTLGSVAYPASELNRIQDFVGHNGDEDAFVAKIGVDSAAVAITPSLDFGFQLIDTTSAVRTVTVTNTGVSPVSILAISDSGANAADFADPVAGSTCVAGSTVLLSGQSCFIAATFTPLAIGNRFAMLDVATTAGDLHAAMSGTGSATGPILSVSDSDLNFDPQLVNTTSAAQSVLLTNTGNATLYYGPIVPAPAAQAVHWTVLTPGGLACNAAGGTLDPGETCGFAVTFNPTAAGADNKFAAISIQWGNGAPVASNLVGTAVIALTGLRVNSGPILQVHPTNLDFGPQTTNTESAPLTLTIKNTGNGPMNYGALSVTGTNPVVPAQFALTGNPPINPTGCSLGGGALGAGASCEVVVRFIPTAQPNPNRYAYINVVSTNGGGSQQVYLSGTAVETPLNNLPVLDFGNVNVGEASAILSVSVVNPGAASIYLEDTKGTGANSFYNLLGANPDDFAVVGGSCAPGLELLAGASCIVNVQFTPDPLLTSTQARYGLLELWAKNGQHLDVSLTGVAVAVAKLKVFSETLNFGNQVLNTKSPAQIVQLVNVGSADLTLPGGIDLGIGTSGLNLIGPNLDDFLIDPLVSTCDDGVTLKPTESCYFLVRFFPNELHTLAAQVQIDSNAIGTPHFVSLTGHGIDLPPDPLAPPGPPLPPMINLNVNVNAATGIGTNPVKVTYDVTGCYTREMFLVVKAPAMGMPGWHYINSQGQWVALPGNLAQITPWMPSGPNDGSYVLFQGTVPPGTYEIYLGCDYVKDGKLNIGIDKTVNGIYDYANVTIQ